MLFPARKTREATTTTLVWSQHADRMPTLHWVGPGTDGLSPTAPTPTTTFGPGLPLLGEHALERYVRPHLRGHRVTPDGAGRSWTPWFVPTGVRETESTLVLDGRDEDAGLAVEVELETVPGGSLRGRASVRNLLPEAYLVEGLEVVLPVADHLVEALDFTGLH